MNRLLAFLAAMLVVWPAMAQTQSTGIGRTIGKKSSAGYVVSLTSTTAAGTYVIGEAFPKSVVGFERGSAFVGTLYACETPTYSAATCTAFLSTLNSDLQNLGFDTTRGWYVLTVSTPESSSNTSYLRIFGGYEIGGGGGGDQDADNDGQYEYSYLWDADGDGSTWETCTAKDVPDPACKVAGERIYRDLADDMNCAIHGGCASAYTMELNGTLYLEPGIYVNWPCWDAREPLNFNDPLATNHNLHNSTSDTAWGHCPATPDPDTTRRFHAIALMDWQGEIIGSGTDTRNPATTDNYKRDQGTYVVDDRGPYWDISTAQAGNNNWFGQTNHVRGFNIGFDVNPGVGTDTSVPSGESAADGDSLGSTTISGAQTSDVLLGDLCVVENAMVTGLVAGDIVLVVGQSGTTSDSPTQVSALRVRTTSTTTDCNGAGTATINIGGRVTSGTTSEFFTTQPDSLRFINGGIVVHTRSDFRDSAARLSNFNLEPQDWWNESGGDCLETGVWTIALDGDGSNVDIDCDTNSMIGIYGAGSPIVENLVIRNQAGYSIDGNSNAGEPLVRRVRWFYGQGGIIMDPGSGWTIEDIEVHESQFATNVTALFGPGVRFDGAKVYNNSFQNFTTLTNINTGNVFERFDFLSNTMSQAFALDCGARMNEFRDIHISGYLAQPVQSNGSVARFNCANTADPIHGNSFSDVWVEGLGPGGNGTGLSHAAILFDADSVIGTSNAAAIIRNSFRNFNMSMRYTDAASEACIFGVHDDEPTTSRSVGGDFSHNAIFGNNSFMQNSVRHFGGGTDWVYCACGQFDSGGNNAANVCEDAHTGTAGGGTNPRGCGNFDNNAAPANETCS